jgi:ABC-type molybdate transport system substrate-binding protein
VLHVAKWFIDFLNNSLVVVVRNHENWKLEKIQIKEPKNIDEIFVPYFVNNDQGKY